MGIYYTPEYIADFIGSISITSYLSERIPEERITLIDNIKILDPACGDGIFLIKSVQTLIKFYKEAMKANGKEISPSEENEQLLHIIKNNIFGIDLDESVHEAIIANLYRYFPALNDKIKSLNNSLESSIRKNIAIADALFEDPFPKIKFDIVLGNPPYVDIKELNYETVKKLFQTFSCVKNRANLFAAFVEVTLDRYINHHGIFGYIIPNSILYNSSYNLLRKKILEECRISNILRMPNKIWKDASVETVILMGSKLSTNNSLSDPLSSYDIDACILSDEKDTSFLKSEESSLLKLFSQKGKVIKVNSSLWYKDNSYRFRLIDKNIHDLLIKIEQDCQALAEAESGLCEISLGITPYDKYKGHSKDDITNRIFHSDKKLDETYKPLISGADIKPFYVEWAGKEYIKYGRWLGAPREERFFKEPHIIVRQIVNGNPPRIYAAFTKDPLYNTQIGFNILLKSSVSEQNQRNVLYYYLLALLNSNLMNFYHYYRFLDTTKTTFQKILIENVRKFPIKFPRDDSKLFQQLNQILVEMVLITRDFYTHPPLSIRMKYNKLDKQINDLIYQIYSLEDYEINLIESCFIV